jgi:small redox-active disulfide protein 2
MLKIEVLGPGCAKCDDTYHQVKQLLDELNVDAEPVKVTDVFQVIDRGVNFTPALIVNGVIVLQGKVPTAEEIRNILKTHISKGNGS